MYYMADPLFRNITHTDDVLEWGAWMETADRVVAQTEVQDVQVSTVFLGLAHEPDYLFETMVFGPDSVIELLNRSSREDVASIWTKVFGGFDVQVRYRTVAEAREGHEAMVKFVSRVLAQRN